MGTAQEKIEDAENYIDELSPGTELLHGQYKIKKFLNSGGFGITYLALNSLDREVVIKECFPSAFCHRSRSIVQVRSRAHTAELKSIVDLFVQEARSLARLDHPNIVGVHQVFEDNETAYMVLDFVQGRDLLDVLEDPNHGLTAEQIKGILRDVLDAVKFIHAQDILHRDISPDNILLDEDMRPVLIDFGAAREEATKQSRVLSALRVVKDGYSPQEFYVQGSMQSPSSDLYALGATFYHLIMGETPPNSQARLAAIAAGEVDLYEPLVDRVKGFDRKFLSAIDKSLGILPKDRVQSAQEWLDIMDGTRRKSRVVTKPLPKSSAAAATLAAEKKSSKVVPLLGSVAVVALVGFGALVGTGTVELPSGGTEFGEATVGAAATPVTAVVQPAPAVPIETVTTSVEPPAPVVEDIAVAEPSVRAVAPPLPAPVQAAVAPVTSLEIDLAEAVPTVFDVAPIAEQAPDMQTPTEPVFLQTLLAPVRAQIKFPGLFGVSDDVFSLAPEAKVTPTPVMIDVLASPVLASAWSVKLPFQGENDTTTIGSVGYVAPAWALRGTEIVAINGTPVEKMSDVNRVVMDTQMPSETGRLPVVFTIKDKDADTTTEQPWQLSVVQETAMSNGLTFHTSFDGTAWVTEVIAIGAANTDLQVGDRIIGYVPTSETLTERTSIADILSREIEAGTEQFSFAVARDGSIWVAALAYEDSASVLTQ